MRPLIQYDLDEPPTVPIAPPAPLQPTARRPPTKKRKRNSHKPQITQSAQSLQSPLQHWDDPGGNAVSVVYDEQEGNTTTPAPCAAAGSVTAPYADDVEEEEEEYSEERAEGDEAADNKEEESRSFTHEEIWDDSVLVDAWNSAEAEYEAYHGTSKPWKTEPVKKSPLWYNKPCAESLQPGPSKPNSRSKPSSQRPPEEQEDGGPELNTAPLDFNTYVPTHDPSLGVPSDTGAQPATTASMFPPPSTTMVSRDEAFNNALSAMYWSGYWTAVYHCQSQSSGKNGCAAAAAEENGFEADEDEED